MFKKILVSSLLTSTILVASNAQASTDAYDCPWTFTHKDSAILIAPANNPYGSTHPVASRCEYTKSSSTFFNHSNWNKLGTVTYPEALTSGSWSIMENQNSFQQAKNNSICEKAIVFFNSSRTEQIAFKITGPYFYGYWKNPFSQEYNTLEFDKVTYADYGDKDAQPTFNKNNKNDSVGGYSIYENCAVVRQQNHNGWYGIPTREHNNDKLFFIDPENTRNPVEVSSPATVLLLIPGLIALFGFTRKHK